MAKTKCNALRSVGNKAMNTEAGVAEIVEVPSILIVEDEPSHVQLLQRAFSRSQDAFDVTCCITVSDALREVSRRSFDVILSDWSLGDGKAIDIIHALSDMPGLHPPVIVMTSFGSETIAVEVMKAGAVDYLVKSPDIFPHTPHLVSRTLREWRQKQDNELMKRALLESELRKRSIVENIQDVYFEIDSTGTVLDVSPSVQGRFGWLPEQVRGSNMRSFLVDGTLLDSILDNIEDLRHLQDAPVDIFDARREIRHCLVTLAHLSTGSAYIAGTLHDVTQLRRTEAELRKLNEQLEAKVEERTAELTRINHQLQSAIEDNEQQVEIMNLQAHLLAETNARLTKTNARLVEYDREKSEMLGIVAHDLKTPLSAILMRADTVRRYGAKLPYEQIQQSMDMIVYASIRMRDIIDHIVNVNAFDSGRVKISPIDMSVKRIIHDIVERHMPIAEKKNIEMRYSSAEISACIDPSAFSHIAENLISNALKFSHEYQLVYITTEVNPGGILVFSVQDSGPGIPEEDQLKLFKKYTRLSTKPTGGEDSTGLGLYIVKKYTDLHGGTIVCKSDIGQGTTFVVSIPCKATEEMIE